MSSNTRLAVAIHVCVLLALAGDECVCSETIARSVDTNAVVIRRLLRALSKAGIVETRLGQGGGARLSKKSRELTLLDIHQAVDDGGGFFGTPAGRNRACHVSCGMKSVLDGAFGQAETAVAKTFAKIRLRDLVQEFR